jgi:hypothetical protein
MSRNFLHTFLFCLWIPFVGFNQMSRLFDCNEYYQGSVLSLPLDQNEFLSCWRNNNQKIVVIQLNSLGDTLMKIEYRDTVNIISPFRLIQSSDDQFILFSELYGRDSSLHYRAGFNRITFNLKGEILAIQNKIDSNYSFIVEYVKRLPSGEFLISGKCALNKSNLERYEYKIPYILKISTDGSIKFLKTFDEENCDIIVLHDTNKTSLFSRIDFAEDLNGHSIVSSITFYKISVEGEIEKYFQLDDKFLLKNSVSNIISISGGFLVCERLNPAYGYGCDIQISYFDYSGCFKWKKTIKSDDEVCQHYFLDDFFVFSIQDGIILGLTNYDRLMHDNIQIQKLDFLGNEVWTEEYGGYGIERLKSIVPLQSGGFVISALTTSFNDCGSGAVWIISVDSNGRNPCYKDRFNQIVVYEQYDSSIYIDKAESFPNYKGIQLIDEGGKVLLQTTDNDPFSLYPSELPSGIYFLKVLSDVDIPLYRYEKK